MDLLRQLKTNYPQLVYLYGQEEVLKEEIIKKYKDEFMPDDFNYIRANLEDLDIESLYQLIHSPPMFANSKVVVLDDFDLAFKKKDIQEEIINNIDGVAKSMTRLLLVGKGSPDKRTKLYKKLNEVGVVVESKFLTTNEQYQWLRRELRRRELIMSKEVEQEFLLVTGDSLRDLNNELDKITAYKAGTDGIITIDEVREIVSPSIESSIFRCVDALGQLNKEDAYKELVRLFNVSEPPLRILSMIIRQIRLIYNTKLLINEKASLDRMRRELRVPNFVAQKLQDQSYNFKTEELQRSLKSLRDLERNVKTGQVDAKYALELWVLGKQ